MRSTRIAALLALLFVTVAATPLTSAEPVGDVTLTVDLRAGPVADVYTGPLASTCLQVITYWEFRLTINNPGLADALTLSTPGGLMPGADVATGLNPHASVHTVTANSCRPVVQVAGFVTDLSAGYTLESCYTHSPGGAWTCTTLS